MKGFRTIGAASIITILGVLQQADIVNLVPNNHRGTFIAALGVGMAILRLFTNTAALKSE